MIEKRLTTLLLANAPLVTLIGTRLFPVAIRKDVGWPVLVYRRLASDPSYVLSGRAGWRTAQVEMMAWGAEYTDARAVAEAVRVALDAHVDALAQGPIRFIAVADGSDDYEMTLDVFGAAVVLTVEYDDEWVAP